MPRSHTWYSDIAQTRVKPNTNIELRQSLRLTYGTLMSLKRLLNITQYKHSRPHPWYSDVAQIHAKHDTYIEARQSLGLTYGPLMSVKCMQHTIQTLSWDNPSASPLVHWCRSNECKTHYKLWVETIPRPRLWYPDVAQMRAKHDANIDLRQCSSLTHSPPMSLRCEQNTIHTLSWDNFSASLMVLWCCSDACKTQYKHSLETIPWPHLWYSDVAQIHTTHNTHIEFRQSLGLTYGILMSLKCVQSSIQPDKTRVVPTRNTSSKCSGEVWAVQFRVKNNTGAHKTLWKNESQVGLTKYCFKMLRWWKTSVKHIIISMKYR